MSASPSKHIVTPYKKPAPTPPKRRASMFWYETVETITKQNFTTKQLERQEVSCIGTVDLYMYFHIIILISVGQCKINIHPVGHLI